MEIQYVNTWEIAQEIVTSYQDDGIEQDVARDILKMIQDASTTSVRENIHAKWVNQFTDENQEHLYGTCSHCSQVRLVDNFCSSCGADMRDSL